jgi:hypothetical protein
MSAEHQKRARERLRQRGVPLDEDFHTLDSDTVERILAAADEHGYRKPRNAPGSRARMFYEYANRWRSTQ